MRLKMKITRFWFSLLPLLFWWAVMTFATLDPLTIFGVGFRYEMDAITMRFITAIVAFGFGALFWFAAWPDTNWGKEQK